MNVRLIFQGKPGTESVGSILQRTLNDVEYTKFTAFVAFTSLAGATFLIDSLDKAEAHLKDVRIFAGVDRQGTSAEALTSLLSSKASVKIVHTTSEPIFHPKLYMFTGDHRVRLIVGSSNLTYPGLFQNVEISTVIDFELTDPEALSLIKTIEIIESSPEQIIGHKQQALTSEIIELLRTAGVVPGEQERWSREDQLDSDTEDANLRNRKSEIHESIMRFFPPVALPKTPRTEAEEAQSNVENNETASTVVDLHVLIAEIPKGSNRWNQANFDIRTFETFFHLGAFGGEQITMVPFKSDGSIGPPESRQNVSVRSKNFRIELGQGSGIPYPSQGRPIGVFLAVNDQEFRYRIIMPVEAEYAEITAILDIYWSGPARQVRRVQVTLREFKKNIINFKLPN